MKDYKICRVCKAVYFKKAWHHGSKINLQDLTADELEWTSRCPACKMVENKSYEGLITITNIPSRSEQDLLRLIKDFSNRAYEKDCQQRLIEINKIDTHIWETTFTDNQLANRLARKLGEAFDHVDIKHSFSPEPQEKVRFWVEFLPLFYHRLNYGRG